MESNHKPIAATYSRVSDPNDKREASIDSQEAAAVVAAEQKGYQVPPEYRFREQYTGMESIYERLVLVHIRELVVAKKLAALACYDTDRLSRDPMDLITIVTDATKNKVECIFARMDAPVTGRLGQMLLYMRGWASATEWDQIRDRTMRGKKGITKEGRLVGGGPCRYGYTWNKSDRSRSINPVTSSVVIRVFNDVASGTPPSDVARKLQSEGVPTPSSSRSAAGSPTWYASTIRIIIREPTYKGVCVAGKTISTGKRRSAGKTRGKSIVTVRPENDRVTLTDARTPPLIDPALWDQANKALLFHAKPGRKNCSEEFMLGGMLWCRECGNRMSPQHSTCKGARFRSYRCTGNSSTRKNPNGCHIQLGAGWLESSVWDAIAARLDDPAMIEADLSRVKVSSTLETMKRDLKAAEVASKKVDVKVSNLLKVQSESPMVRRIMNEQLADLEREGKRFDSQAEKIRERIASLADFGQAADDLRAAVSYARTAIQQRELAVLDKKKLCVSLGVRVTAWKRGSQVELMIPPTCGYSESTSRDTSRLPGSCVAVILTSSAS